MGQNSGSKLDLLQIWIHNTASTSNVKLAEHTYISSCLSLYTRQVPTTYTGVGILFYKIKILRLTNVILSLIAQFFKTANVYFPIKRARAELLYAARWVGLRFTIFDSDKLVSAAAGGCCMGTETANILPSQLRRC